MRRDQPKLEKAFKELRDRIALRDKQIKHRENIVDFLVQKNRDLELDVLVARIEYDRLLAGKRPLTIKYHIANKVADELFGE
jgi:hypothetical protein